MVMPSGVQAFRARDSADVLFRAGRRGLAWGEDIGWSLISTFFSWNEGDFASLPMAHGAH